MATPGGGAMLAVPADVDDPVQVKALFAPPEQPSAAWTFFSTTRDVARLQFPWRI